jgi:outer membrane protein OmpA-like peptidoglycan-associated protein
MGKAKIVNNKIEVPGKVHFDTDKATIKDNAETKDVLDSISKTMTENKGLTLLVIGSTDNKGTRDHNLKLSTDRANAVVDKLVAMGVEKTRLQAKGWGPDKPIAANDTDDHREQNRRTDFYVLSMDNGATQTDEGKAALNDPAGGATAPAAGGTTGTAAPAGTTATPAPKK